jgi:hypothetical protein
MRTATAKPPSSATEAVDLAYLMHLGQHPVLKPLFERRTALRTRLAAIRQEHTVHRRRVYELRDVTNDFSAIATRKEAERRITDLEDEGGAAEAELRQLQVTIETTEAAVKVELRPLLAREGIPIMSSLIAALEQLATTSAAYEAYSARHRSIVGDGSLPSFGFDRLGACCTYAQEALARLQQLAAQEG